MEPMIPSQVNPTARQGGRLNADACYRAVLARDPRFDGWFFVGVRTTGIYCRPSCPTPIHPKPENVDFFETIAGAQSSGLRACKRCRPDFTPGSPLWNTRTDVVARALRLIGDGTADRVGVAGLAAALHISERHLHRVVQSELGTTPISLVRAQRAQTARMLIEMTDMPLGEVGFAAGFGSIRQFNDTLSAIYACAPGILRASRSGANDQRHRTGTKNRLSVRLPFREPFDSDAILRFLAARAISGVESVDQGQYIRTMRLPGGPGIVTVTPTPTSLTATFELATICDLSSAIGRVRRLFDLDLDPVETSQHLSEDRSLDQLTRRFPGFRCPGSIDGWEVLVKAIMGQQVSLAAARTLGSRLAARVGEFAQIGGPDQTEPDQTKRGEIDGSAPRLETAPVALLFPSPEAVAQLDVARFAMPERRAQCLINAARAVVDGRVDLGTGCDRETTRKSLEGLGGIGPWTTGYVMLRGLGDPDICLSSDLVVMKSARNLGIADSAKELDRKAAAWAPWRSYATQLLWNASAEPAVGNTSGNRSTEETRT